MERSGATPEFDAAGYSVVLDEMAGRLVAQRTNGVDRLTGKFHDKPGLLLAARTALKKKRVLELRRAVLACAEAQSGIFFTNVKSEFQAAQAFQAVHGIDDFTWSQPEVQTAFKKAWAATAVLRLLYQSPELGGGLRASLAGQFPVIFLRRGTPRAEYAHRLNVSGGSSPNQPW